MESQKWKKKDIAIKDLFLWDENARFPATSELFSKMVFALRATESTVATVV
ncbi:MAG: hypothetical protein AAB545_02105 [Patescibacteria group bacterium]